jgi:ankyrin repeat protein
MVKLGSTPSHGNPASTNALNTELNNVARNTNDTAKARALVAQGADLSSTNGPAWRHTPLHQAAYHGRYEMAETLVELGAPLDLHSNPCGRGATGTPLELAQGGGHHKIAQMLQKAAGGAKTNTAGSTTSKARAAVSGKWLHYQNIDMCCQGDVEIIGDWKKQHTVESLKKIVEAKGYSAVCVGSFGHAALKSFDYQLTKEHCAPSRGYTNDLYIFVPGAEHAKPPKPVQASPALPPGFAFHDGVGEATRGDQIGHITSGGIENHCFGGDRFNAPLQWAAMIGDVAAINTLCDAGHDPNMKMARWFDSEPLGWAASFGQCRAIEALVANGADPRRPANLAGNPPLSDAQREGHSKAIALIEQYLSGARPIGTRRVESQKATAGPSEGVPMVVAEVVVGNVQEPAPPLHDMAARLRTELGLPEMPMYKLIERAASELGIEHETKAGATLIEKAEAAWKALLGGGGK